MKTLALIAAAGMASTAAAQDLCITVAPDGLGGNGWTIEAELLTAPPSPIIQIWANAGFQLSGDGAINITSYNASYDTTLGDAVLTDNGTNTVGFTGDADGTGFFGTPDASNPLAVASFTYDGTFQALGMSLVGQNSAIFDLPPFNDIRLYQDAQGNAGSLSFEIKIIPAPASAALLGLGGLAAVRRRR